MSRRRVRVVFVVLLVLVVLLLPGWLLVGQISAWRSYRAAQAALKRDDPQTARAELAFCMKVWPSNGEVRFLAARAARRCGELDEAVRLLDEAAERNWVRESIDLEWALLRAQTGEFDSVKGYLAECLKKEHPDEVLILEVIVPIFLRNYDLGHATGCLARWRELRPSSALAWRYQGMLADLSFNREAAAEAYTEALRLDPSNREDQLALARALLHLNKPKEALPLLEGLNKGGPVAPEVLLLLARCYRALGRLEEARRWLVLILEATPNSADALHLRGRLELDAGQPEKAAHFLKLALEREAFDRELLYSYLLCLRRQERVKEIAVIEKRLEQVEADLARMRKLTRQIATQPDDPEPRRQAGEIMLKNRQEKEGLRWLQSALDCRPDHRATHKALADHFENQGDHKRAAPHRAYAPQRRDQRKPDSE
jgi:predicted Zn-dependent protease